MYKSSVHDDTTDINILKRRNESMKKENDLLKKQYQDIKSQLESTSSKNNGMYSSGYHDGVSRPGIRKELNQNKEILMKDLEV